MKLSDLWYHSVITAKKACVVIAEERPPIDKWFLSKSDKRPTTSAMQERHKTYLWPMTKRMTIPFSFSNFFLFSPFGIQVSRTESLRFRLLKAVLIPITIKYFLFEFPDGVSFDKDWCSALAAANFISKIDISLSSVLHSIHKKIRSLFRSLGPQTYEFYRNSISRAYWNAYWVSEALRLPTFWQGQIMKQRVVFNTPREGNYKKKS